MTNEHAVLEGANDNLRCNKLKYTVTNTDAHKGFSGGSLHITVSISK